MRSLLYILILGDQILVASIFHWFPGVINSGNDRWFSYLPMGWSLFVSIVILSLLSYYAQLPKKSPMGFQLLAAGIASNLLSYLIYGKVLDYIPLPTTYANAADLLIVLGCGVALYEIVRGIKPSSQLS